MIRLNQWRQDYPTALEAAEEATEVLGQLGMSSHARFGIDLHELLTRDSVTEVEEEEPPEDGPQNQSGAGRPE